MGTPTKWHSSPSGLHVLRCGCAYSAEPILGIGEAKTIEESWTELDCTLGCGFKMNVENFIIAIANCYGYRHRNS